MRLIGLDKRQQRAMPTGIETLGHIDDPAELARHYSEASVFVNPSSAEANNITKMEALACGTPVVTYDAGGAAEGINPGCGAAVAPGDFHGLADAIAACSDLSMHSCRQTAMLKFDMRRNLAAYFNLYGRLTQA